MSTTPHRLLGYATDPFYVQLLQAVAAAGGDGLESVLHIGGREADYKGSSLFRLSRVKGARGHLMDEDAFHGAGRALATGAGLNDGFVMATDHLHRAADGFTYRPHALKTLHDYQHYYHIAADVLGALLDREGITQVLFFDTPHLFTDTVLYQQAVARNIPVLILQQWYLEKRFLSFRRIEDLGCSLPVLPETEPFSVPWNSRQEWYYMKGVAQDRATPGRLKPRDIGRLLWLLLMRDRGALLRPVQLWRTARRMAAAARRLPDWRDPFARFFDVDQLAYVETLGDYEDRPVDLDARFVYMPLHMQPEMTTASLGGRYTDQLLALERLSEMLPDGVRVYVKENPKQSGMMRGPMFFHRLRRMKNVVWVASHTDTHVLTERAEAVATITGTAGWEALANRTPVLVFGHCWYRNLPGVTAYQPGLTYDQVVRPVPEAALEAALGALRDRARPGIVLRHRAKALPDLDYATNAAEVGGHVWRVLSGQEAPTFEGAVE